MNELSTEEFDYSLLSGELAKKIKEKDYILIGLHSKYSEEVGKVLYEAQKDFSDYNNGGMFEKWYTSRGFKKRNVYNYIQIYNEVQNLHGDKLEVFQELPKSLQIETSKKSVDAELKEKVLSGDITTHKQFKEMERAKKEAELRAKQAESQAEQARRSERIAQKQLDEELSKEPKVVERVIEDTSKINRLEQELNLMKQKLEKESQDAETYRQLKKDIDKLESEKSQVIRQINNVSSIGKFISKVERSFEEDLAPVKYSDAISELSNSDVAVESLEKIVSKVENWCEEIRGLMKDKNIVEVIDYEEK